MVYQLACDQNRNPLNGGGMFTEADKFRTKGLVVPRDLVVQDISVNAEFPMPEICEIRHNMFVVSNYWRMVAERHASNQIEYIPIKIAVPSRMNPAEEYFFINVLPRAQLIDWQATATRIRPNPAEDGREVLLSWGKLKFKPLEELGPAIWQETDVELPDRIYLTLKADIYLTKKFWEDLNKNFPNQMTPARRF
jgi:hypothetical protein